MQISCLQTCAVATSSRLCIIILALLSYKNILSHSPSGVFKYSSDNMSSLSKTFIQWDSSYYVHIANYGYALQSKGYDGRTGQNSSNIDEIHSHIQLFAFYQLYPIILNSTASVIHPIISQSYRNANITFDDSLVISGLAISNISFILSAYVYKLILNILIDPSYHSIYILTFCVNPASIFFTTVYTESLFMLTSWTGILCSLYTTRASSNSLIFINFI